MDRHSTIEPEDRWIPEAEYTLICARVPIPCVDLVLLSNDRPARVGLILREIGNGKTGWSLVGGTVLLNESLVHAAKRHCKATLGKNVTLDLESFALLDVLEYFKSSDIGDLHNPRMHAVAVVYSVVCGGENLSPAGEALEFRWWDPDQLRDLGFAFDQAGVIKRMVLRLC